MRSEISRTLGSRQGRRLKTRVLNAQAISFHLQQLGLTARLTGQTASERAGERTFIGCSLICRWAVARAVLTTMEGDVILTGMRLGKLRLGILASRLAPEKQ